MSYSLKLRSSRGINVACTVILQSDVEKRELKPKGRVLTVDSDGDRVRGGGVEL